MLPRKERPLLDANLNEDERLLPKDKDKTRSGLLGLIKKKKKNAPTPPKRSSSFREDSHHDRRGLSPDPRDSECFNNGITLPMNDLSQGLDSTKLLVTNNNGALGIANGAPAFPGPLFPWKKGAPAVPGPGGKAATTPPSEEESMSNSKRFLWSSSMPAGSDGTEWKSVTLPRDLGQRRFDSGTFGGKPALPRKRTGEPKGENARRRGTLTPPPRLNASPDILAKDADPSPGSSPQALTPKAVRRPELPGPESSKTSALHAEFLKANVLPALGAAAEESRARRQKHAADSASLRERGKLQKPKPAPPPPPTSSKSSKVSRSPTQELPSPSSSSADIKAKLPSLSEPHHTTTGGDPARSPPGDGAKKLPLGSACKPQPLKTSSSCSSVSASFSSQSLGGFSSLSSPVDQSSPTAFIPLVNTRRSLRKTAPRQASERTPNSAVTRDMVLEGTELLRAAICRNSEQTGSHSAVLEAGKNLSKYCISYVDSIQQMRNKFAFREAINKLESSLRELQICPAATGGANAQQDFSKLLSSVKEISDIVQR